MNKITDMKLRPFLGIAVAAFLASCSSQKTSQNEGAPQSQTAGQTAHSKTMKYPETKKISHTDEYFGTKVEDPYRWLEDDRAADTKDWVKREVAFTNDYLSQITCLLYTSDAADE